ncbi:hypothetical protein ACQ86O_15650 [Serratia sp. L9]|uniref:hypothetical protein n=1 Tax=Serratia sp. L9 TaxID=3423946 RepID=UPI003D670EAA
MNNTKIITLFNANENIPFLTCIVEDVEENEHGIKLTLENDNNIDVKDYDSFFCLNQRMIATRKEWLMYIGN